MPALSRFHVFCATVLVLAAFSAHAAANRVDTIGVYRPSTGEWLLRNSNTAGAADLTVVLGGQPGDLPVAGDWNGDGRTDIGVFRNGTFILGVLVNLRNCFSGTCTSTTGVVVQPSITFGSAGDLPVAGDWDGDGKDDLGVFHIDTALNSGVFILRIPHTVVLCQICAPSTVVLTQSHNFGGPGDLPVAGDWNGDGIDTFGVWVPGSPGTFILTDDFVKPQIVFPFGNTGNQPLVGNWIGGDTDLVGVFVKGLQPTMNLATVLGNSPDLIFRFGTSSDKPVAGHWAN